MKRKRPSAVPEEKEAARILLNHFTADIENELKHVDPNVQITMASTDRPDKYISDYDAEKLILAYMPAHMA